MNRSGCPLFFRHPRAPRDFEKATTVRHCFFAPVKSLCTGQKESWNVIPSSPVLKHRFCHLRTSKPLVCKLNDLVISCALSSLYIVFSVLMLEPADWANVAFVGWAVPSIERKRTQCNSGRRHSPNFSSLSVWSTFSSLSSLFTCVLRSVPWCWQDLQQKDVAWRSSRRRSR